MEQHMVERRCQLSQFALPLPIHMAQSSPSRTRVASASSIWKHCCYTASPGHKNLTIPPFWELNTPGLNTLHLDVVALSVPLKIWINLLDLADERAGRILVKSFDSCSLPYNLRPQILAVTCQFEAAGTEDWYDFNILWFNLGRSEEELNFAELLDMWSSAVENVSKNLTVR